MQAVRSDTPLNRARRIFVSEYARIEQAVAQRTPPCPIEVKRMEFNAVRKIAAELGVEM